MAHFRTVPYQFLTMAHQHKPPTRPHNFPRLLASRHWSKQKFPLKKKDSYRKNYKKHAPALTLTHQNLSTSWTSIHYIFSKYHRLGIRRLFDSLNFWTQVVFWLFPKKPTLLMTTFGIPNFEWIAASMIQPSGTTLLASWSSKRGLRNWRIQHGQTYLKKTTTRTTHPIRVTQHWPCKHTIKSKAISVRTENGRTTPTAVINTKKTRLNSQQESRCPKKTFPPKPPFSSKKAKTNTCFLHGETFTDCEFSCSTVTLPW